MRKSKFNENQIVGILHDSLGRVPPLTFLPRPTTARESTYAVSTRRGSLRPRLPLRPGVQAAIASEDNHTVTSPRRTKA